VEAAFRHAAEVHRNHPTIQLIRTNTDEMVSSSEHVSVSMCMCFIAPNFIALSSLSRFTVMYTCQYVDVFLHVHAQLVVYMCMLTHVFCVLEL